MINKDKVSCETLGVMATVSPGIVYDAASRIAMAAHHLGQAITPADPDINRFMAGFEKQLTTFDIVMPVNGIITGVIRKFPRELGEGAISSNPLITIIFQCQETGKYDTLDITTFHSKHKIYGTRYILEPIVQHLSPRMPISKGTVFARNVSKKNGIFANGLSVSVANISDPCTIDDGYGVSRSFCERGALLELPAALGTWGKSRYPLNLYGTKDKYKPFPDIGEAIRADGLVFAFREYDPLFDALDMSVVALSPESVDTIHDILVYTTPYAIVHDIIAVSGIGETKAKPTTPIRMAEQAERYINYDHLYYDNILKIYDDIVRASPTKNLNLSPKLIILISRAYGDRPNHRRLDTGTIIKRTIKDIPIDEYRIEIKLHHRRKLGKGSKITGFHGNKGVVCKIIEDEDRPIDIAGNYIDVIKYVKSNVARMNAGLTYEQYINAASRDLSVWIRNSINTTDFDTIWSRLYAYYLAVSPVMAERIERRFTDEDKRRHVDHVIADGIYIILPPDACHMGVEMYDAINAVIVPVYDRVSYVNSVGRRVLTKNKIFVGVEQMIILEKTDQNPMAISSGLRQMHGLLAGSNKITKHRHATKHQPVKTFSATETRAWAATIGPRVAADMLLLSNSPEAHKIVVAAIMNSPRPTQLSKLPDLPRDTSRPLRYVNNIFTIFGLPIVNK
jgi:hypothetical protein